MDKEKLQLMAFDIIGHAGDAFAKFYEAVEEARKNNFAKADELMAEGEAMINNAHQAQSDLLAAEAREEDVQISLIVVHSQDHLMTTIMYQRMARQLIDILKELDARNKQ